MSRFGPNPRGSCFCSSYFTSNDLIPGNHSVGQVETRESKGAALVLWNMALFQNLLSHSQGWKSVKSWCYRNVILYARDMVTRFSRFQQRQNSNSPSRQVFYRCHLPSNPLFVLSTPYLHTLVNIPSSPALHCSQMDCEFLPPKIRKLVSKGYGCSSVSKVFLTWTWGPKFESQNPGKHYIACAYNSQG